MNEENKSGTPAEGAEGVEPEPEQGFIRELSQFFIVPSLIVVLCIAIFAMFGLLTYEDQTAREFLQEVRHGRGSDRWLAAFEMSRLLAQKPELREDDELVREIIDTIKAEQGGDPSVRMYLITALENLGHPDSVPVIVESLGDPDPNVRLQAAKTIGGMEGIESAVQPLAALLEEEDASIRKVAIYALGQTGSPDAIPLLLPTLEDPVVDIRWNSALALAVLGDATGRSVIAEMLDRDHLDSVEGITNEQKVSALINGVQAVYLLRDETLLPAVRRISTDDPSLRVREIALRALEQIDSERSKP
jgi:HEAT repeat protein